MSPIYWMSALILQELTDCSVKGISLLDNLEEFIKFAEHAYRLAPPDFGQE